MKLTEPQRQALYHLSIVSVQVVDEDTTVLAKHGLAEIKKSRFGTYAYATRKGLDLAKAEPLETQLKRCAEYHRGVTSYAFKASSSVGGSEPATSRDFSRGAVPRIAAATATQVIPALSGPPSVTRPSTESLKTTGTAAHVEHMRPLGPSAAKAVKKQRATSPAVIFPPVTPPGKPIPNAARVTVGAKVTYYPTSMLGALHGTKALVVTLNKPFKSYPVGASAGDVEVPQ